jgi:protein SCO1/2
VKIAGRELSLIQAVIATLVAVVLIGAYFSLRPPRISMTVGADAPPLPDFHLTDIGGHKRSLADYRGRTVMIFFGFTRCPDVCPTEFFKLAQAMRELGPDSDRIQVLFITLDPERDTPEVLSKYVTAFDKRFMGLTGTNDQIYAAAKSFGVTHVKLPVGSDYTIDHSIETHVIDAEQRRWFIGSARDSPGQIVADLRVLLDQESDEATK